jgi:hypothetical protein
MLIHSTAKEITGCVGLHGKQHRSASRFLVSEMHEYAEVQCRGKMGLGGGQPTKLR